MRIIPNDTVNKRYVKKYWRELRKTLVLTRAGVLDRAEHVDPERLKEYLPALLDSKPMKEQIINLWGEVGGKFGNDTQNMLKAKKAEIAGIEFKSDKDQWTEKMRKYSAQRTAKKVEAIMSTESEAINKVIDSVLERSLTDGLGIPETRRLMRDSLDEELTTIENWQAQRIAMTEVGSAQNTSSYLAAQENSEGVKKIWMFMPGMKTFRENHQGFEEMGPVEMDYEFAPGLTYPGDPNGAAEEVINCYCTIAYETEI